MVHVTLFNNKPQKQNWNSSEFLRIEQISIPSVLALAVVVNVM